jgi:PPOX class probable F420-dependent enzyme
MTGNLHEKSLLELLSSGHRGVLVTIKRDGRPQLSNVDYAYDEAARVLRISTTDDTAKTANLRRDPRASFHVSVPGGWSYAVVEGVAELSPIAAERSDATVEELIEVFREVQGEHPDWEEYRDAMVTDRRLVLRLPVQRVYGWIRPA